MKEIDLGKSNINTLKAYSVVSDLNKDALNIQKSISIYVIK